MGKTKRPASPPRTFDTLPPWLSKSDVAWWYSCSCKTVDKMSLEGTIPSPTYFGRLPRWRKAELLTAAETERPAMSNEGCLSNEFAIVSVCECGAEVTEELTTKSNDGYGEYIPTCSRCGRQLSPAGRVADLCDSADAKGQP